MKLSSEVGSELERKHLGARGSQAPCYGAGACSDVDDDITGRNTGPADEVGCEPAATKKVPTGRALCGSPDGHGKPP